MKVITNSHIKKMYKRTVNNKMRLHGETDLDNHTIKINKKYAKTHPTYKRPVNKHASKYPELLDTIVHEAHHAKHPMMHEKTVRKHTRTVVQTLSRKQKQRYYKLFA